VLEERRTHLEPVEVPVRGCLSGQAFLGMVLVCRTLQLQVPMRRWGFAWETLSLAADVNDPAWVLQVALRASLA